MKKLLYILCILGIILLALKQCHDYKQRHCYDDRVPPSVLVKEVIVDLKDSDCYKKYGIYKRIYRKYNYEYTDSLEDMYGIDTQHVVHFATTYKGDTIFMEFVDYSNFPRREE